jgi:phage tail sheath protein FI
MRRRNKMPFQVSPGVNVSEIDLTTVVPAVSTVEGAFAGQFRWGPVEQRVLVDSEDRFVNIFHKPTSDNAEDFFTAANFLAYGNQLYTVRVVNTSDAKTAITATANTQQTLVKNSDDYEENYGSGITGVGELIAKYPGELGNSLKFSMCQSPEAWESTITSVSDTYSITTQTPTLVFNGDGEGTSNSETKFVVGDILLIGPDKEQMQIKSLSGNTVTFTGDYSGNTVTRSTASITRRWEYFNNFDQAPGTSAYANNAGAQADELHVVVADEDGKITGVKGQVLEVFANLSKASDAKDDQGAGTYYKEVLNQQSGYVWWAGHDSNMTNAGSAAAGLTFSGDALPVTKSFVYGNDGTNITGAQKITGYNLFKSAEDVSVSLILGGNAGQTLATHIIQSIAESRKDCIAIISPERADVVNNNAYEGKERDDIIAYRDLLPSSSYGVMDSGWKYQYDKYNDVYRYIPLNADTAGLMVQTDLTRDPWYSPAGFNRGNVKNVIKLAYNPPKADRDQLYKKGVNPVTTFPGQGTVLFGDKTMLTKPSAFDRINVRRLFIVLERAISTAAKFTLFEFNDEFTRSQFKNLVEPFLRDVQGRRGITDFVVVCDGTNNTGEVIDRNEFVGDIYIKPARSINFIQLNFVAVRTGVEFSEVVGRAG